MEICKIHVERLKNFKLKNKREFQEVNVVLGGMSYTFKYYFFDDHGFVEIEDTKKKT